MKKRVIFSLIILVVFTCFSNVYAASCPNSVKKDLVKAASYVKADYEIIDESEEKELDAEGNKTTYLVPNFKFDISIYNLTEDLYAHVTTSDKVQDFNVYYTDTQDGIYSMTDYNFGTIYNYNIEIKSNNLECSDYTIRTIKFTKPRYNAYSEYSYCKKSSNYYCQKFLGTEVNIKSTEDFMKKVGIVESEETEEESTIEETPIELFNQNKVLYISIFASVVVILGVVIAIVLVRRKNRRTRL